jgi:hypothetical protein
VAGSPEKQCSGVTVVRQQVLKLDAQGPGEQVDENVFLVRVVRERHRLGLDRLDGTVVHDVRQRGSLRIPEGQEAAVAHDPIERGLRIHIVANSRAASRRDPKSDAPT